MYIYVAETNDMLSIIISICYCNTYVTYILVRTECMSKLVTKNYTYLIQNYKYSFIPNNTFKKRKTEVNYNSTTSLRKHNLHVNFIAN